MKEKAIIESYDEQDFNKVCVLPYDSESKEIVGGIIDTISRDDSFEIYDVLGEMINGELILYGEEEDEDDYYSEFGFEEE